MLIFSTHFHYTKDSRFSFLLYIILNIINRIFNRIIRSKNRFHDYPTNIIGTWQYCRHRRIWMNERNEREKKIYSIKCVLEMYEGVTMKRWQMVTNILPCNCHFSKNSISLKYVCVVLFLLVLVSRNCDQIIFKCGFFGAEKDGRIILLRCKWDKSGVKSLNSKDQIKFI